MKIGPKGWWKLSTIFMLKNVSWLVNNKITGKYLYFLDRYIFTALFKTSIALLLVIKFTFVAYKKTPYIFLLFFFQWNFPLI